MGDPPPRVVRLVGAARNPVTNERLTFSVDEAAKLLGIGRDLCYQLVHSGELRSIRRGRRILVPRVAIEELLNGEGARPANL